ncbi:T9SS type B sorting domain-containing protein [Solitalea koreensis]|uniref:Conserved repeat domain-containing protein/gliding motility-associated C-terminal domain-containing protein/fimbrial isopeptide formation D2 domain-containing protein n=1 Tax=Solitalea koreensis TaxID=543615 RepID=A0A521DVM3_9SPHI|nr:gliding motility-associated C-terminal domain-containing protein [Solitalea koreensis]SMO75746.1 conserved repeat domain-containing protein/gliding motility-associated C-terminal domain-containing protein/fimbrial isopeptide formation D2 domain-containing protein [Solitalea koreensis]
MYTRSQRSPIPEYYTYTRWLLVLIFVVLIVICFGSFANAKAVENVRSNATFLMSSLFAHRSSILFAKSSKPDSADIYVSKSVSISTTVLGQKFDYTIKVGNKGPSVSKQVLMIDTLPDNIDYQSSVVSVGAITVNGKIVTWELGDMNVAALETLTLTVVTVKKGTFRNKANLKSQTPDCNKCNQAISPQVQCYDFADIGIQKTVNKDSVLLGDTFEYKLKVSNKGPLTAQSTYVIDTLPKQLEFVSASLSVGTFGINDNNFKWTVGDVPNGQSAEAILKVKAVHPGVFTNSAIVYEQSSDPVLEDTISTSPTVIIYENADVSVFKVANQSVIALNDEFYYTVTVKNSGPTSAKMIKVADTLSESLEYIGAEAGSGIINWEPNQRLISWDSFDLSNGEEVVLKLKVKAIKIGELKNIASVKSSVTDNNLSNNTSECIKNVIGLRIPNVFSPNGDDINDTFVIDGIEAWHHNELTVMNRWGNNVFYKENYKNDWNGSSLLPGTYFYVITVSNETTQQQVFTGWVLIK